MSFFSIEKELERLMPTLQKPLTPASPQCQEQEAQGAADNFVPYVATDTGD